MKYLKLLEERQLKVTDLQKAVQKKISDIENLSNSVNELNKIVDLDDDDKSTLADLEEAISSLDEYLARKIEIFNPETYAKKLEVMKTVQSKRKHLSDDKADLEVKAIQVKEVEVKETEIKEVEVKEVEQEQQQDKYEQQDESEQYDDEYYYEDDEEEAEQAKVVEMPNKVEAKKALLQQKLDNLKQSITVRDEHFEDGGEVDEFSRVDNVKPKKMTTPLIIMGIGALILTLGAVNFFKRR